MEVKKIIAIYLIGKSVYVPQLSCLFYLLISQNGSNPFSFCDSINSCIIKKIHSSKIMEIILVFQKMLVGRESGTGSIEC